MLVSQSICIKIARAASLQLGRAAECRRNERVDVESNLRYLFEGKMIQSQSEALANCLTSLAGSFSRSALGQTRRLDHDNNYDLNYRAPSER
jgi:hypothetical protein